MYDAIIIGRDLSSLIAALMASRRGLKTVLISEGNQEAEYRDAGYIFPIDATPISGFGQEQIILRLLMELNLLPDEAPQLLLMDPAFQVILPGHRVDFFHNRERLISDITREFPQHEQEIRRFYHAVNKSSVLIERWLTEDSVKKLYGFKKLIREMIRFTTAIIGRSSLIIRGTSNTCALRRIIEAQVATLSSLDINCLPFPIFAAYLLTLPTRGVYYPVGGQNAWLNWLRKGFTDAGGKLIDGCSIMRVDTRPDINVDLEDLGSSTTIRGKTLIVSNQWEKISLLLFQQKIFRRLVNRLDCNRPHAYPFCLHMGILADGIPEKITPYTIVIPDENKPARNQNLLFLETSLPSDTYRAPQGRRAVSVTVYLKESPLVLNNSELKAIAKTTIDSLDWFLPFLRESIDYINIERSIAFARQSQEIITKKYPLRKRSITATNTFSPKTPLSNVFLTGGILRAGLGFEGEILSGIDVASLVVKEIQGDGQKYPV